MKITAKLRLVTILSICVSLAVGFTLFLISQEVDKAVDRNKIADEIARRIFELNTITYEYLLHSEERMKEQWRARHDSLTSLLREVEFKGTEVLVLQDRILRDHESIQVLFSQLVSTYERYGNNRKEILSELRERVMGQMLVKSHTMVSSAFQLAEVSRLEIEIAQKRASLLLMVFIAITALALGGISFVISKSVVRGITKLHEGTEIVGAGNLNYRVGMDAKDEIGQLSRAFDEMVDKRKVAEEEVLQLNADLERRVAERTAQLKASNKELEAFSYSVSHDLRAPLRSIDGFSQALLEDYPDRLDEQGRHYLARVRAGTQRMGELIDDMLQLSRVTRAEMHREPVDLSVLADSVVADLRRTEPQRQVDVTIQPGLQAEGDSKLLRIALVNLLSNAWKFTGRQPAARIEMGTQDTGNERAFYVRDNGVGFDMAYAPKLFSAFQRLHAQGEFPGTGIGLATVQRIVHRHGGRVWAEGAVNQGATFYFALPPIRST